MYPYVGTEGLHYATSSYAATFMKDADDGYTFRLCPAGEVSDIDVRLISEEAGPDMRVEYRSFYPTDEIPAFTLRTEREDIFCEISTGSEKVILMPRPKPDHLKGKTEDVHEDP
jgi:hypothetical protein